MKSFKTLKTKKNKEKLQKKKNKQLKKRSDKMGGMVNNMQKKKKHSLKKPMSYNKKGGGDYEINDNFNNEYDNVMNKEDFEGALRGLGDGLKIEQPIGAAENRQPMPEMPECCVS